MSIYICSIIRKVVLEIGNEVSKHAFLNLCVKFHKNHICSKVTA